MVWEKTLAESVQDVKDDFMMAVKKAIIDFVLQDPSFVRTSAEIDNAFKQEMKQTGTSFRANFASAKVKIARNLHIEFKYMANKHIEKCKATFMDQYFYQVTDVFLQGNKKGKLPDPSKMRKVVSFYNAVAAIMTHHLQMLCMKSLYDYVKYITDVKVSSSIAILY
ncbi:unnamed protein product [Acanthoscelides obtectus]|uniref:Uncharacterized protein n=1 Tax=Acanthoscelides obtectus TaxID=200917 RepID=A0A9P0VNI2_ACAOB|nr:unnamed protein product [Acanthoscelides obtectus]CAK1629749.1 Dynein heavy chain 7, axonemal [Acanthoscelides obtectus]